MPNAEKNRVDQISGDIFGWRQWGPFLSERSWAGVREDYSPNGDAWGYFPHDHARSRTYRWGDDGLGGLCDRYQFLCLAHGFWNEKDSIIKERFFGLTPKDGNHGEDVKEYYFYEDNTPTHSYMRMLYKYPQKAYPYRELAEGNRARNGRGPEYELVDTGIFDQNRYFDIVLEYAKLDEQSIAIRIEAHNRGPDPAPLHILPQLWFRNIWGWTKDAWGPEEGRPTEPIITTGPESEDWISVVADDSLLPLPMEIASDYRLGLRYLFGSPGGEAWFTDNETNALRIFGPQARQRKPYHKDAFHRYLINGEQVLKPDRRGTKAGLHYRFERVEPGQSAVVRMLLTPRVPLGNPLALVDQAILQRKLEADQFYESIHPEKATTEDKAIQRQALAGLLWTKQTYIFDVEKWFEGDNPDWPPPPERKKIRNEHWRHINSHRVMIPAAKWEYPWFAAWDLAFTCPAIALVDQKFAKDQLYLLLFEQFQHPNGQIPAYEWEFSDLNPPVHAWAVWRVFNMDRIRNKVPDRNFLEKCFHKLLINFTWWVNKVDKEGNNIFEGGFLGMDNITAIDRSIAFYDGSSLMQADACGYMAMFCLNMMRIALELAKQESSYEFMAIKFFQHYAYIAGAMKKRANLGASLWDETDGFFYDVLKRPDGRLETFRLRSLVGLIPLFAVERLEAEWISPFRDFHNNLQWFLKNRRDLIEGIVHHTSNESGDTYALTILDQTQLKRTMGYLHNEEEFLSEFGVRSLSRYHLNHPFHFEGVDVIYEPAESDSKLKGGNSNWRGPVWFPTGFLLIESLRKLGKAFGGDLRIETPASNGKPVTFHEIAKDIAMRMIKIFQRDPNGRRPFYGNESLFQNDPYWRDHLLFFEYFHGDNGSGLGAQHQTGWTGLIANLIDEWSQ